MPALVAAARKKRKDVVRAALLAALRECGGDAGEFLSPRALGAEASRGLKSKTPASLAAWFDFDSLPPVHWSDGAGEPADLVDPAVIQEILYKLFCHLLDSESRACLMISIRSCPNSSANCG